MDEGLSGRCQLRGCNCGPAVPLCVSGETVTDKTHRKVGDMAPPCYARPQIPWCHLKAKAVHGGRGNVLSFSICPVYVFPMAINNEWP